MAQIGIQKPRAQTLSFYTRIALIDKSRTDHLKATASHFSVRTKPVDAADDGQQWRQAAENDDDDGGDDQFELPMRPPPVGRQRIRARFQEVEEVGVALRISERNERGLLALHFC